MVIPIRRSIFKSASSLPFTWVAGTEVHIENEMIRFQLQPGLLDSGILCMFGKTEHILQNYSASCNGNHKNYFTPIRKFFKGK